MNIISSLVGLSMVGAAMPLITQMAITPVVAQRQATNFGEAEVAAVTYAALNEGSDKFTPVPEDCTLAELGNQSYAITCVRGKKLAYRGTVTRAFRNVGDPSTSYAGNKRTYANSTPSGWGPHQCLDSDPWGVQWWNEMYEKHVGACTPQPFWSKENYLASNPDDWLYDMNNVNGWGHHPDY